MVKLVRSTFVSKSMEAADQANTTLTDTSCRDHLNDKYHEHAQARKCRVLGAA
jgi:hypothetical protein